LKVIEWDSEEEHIFIDEANSVALKDCHAAVKMHFPIKTGLLFFDI